MNQFGLEKYLHLVRANAYKATIIGARRALFVATFLTVSTGFSLAQAFLPTEVWSISTVPSNGDVNPYGVAFVPDNFSTVGGTLQHGDVLVSNFNNRKNLQGTGTTIVRISSSGVQSLFFQGKGPLGLSTALGTLRAGFVVVGNAPTKNGTAATASPGSLLVINNQGQLVQSITSPDPDSIQYPWDMTLVDNGDTAMAFVSNALNGTVIRLGFAVSPAGLTLTSHATIASGYVNRGDPVTLFVAPTGTVFDPVLHVLYVASTGDNAIYSIPDADSRQSSPGNGVGDLIYQDNVHLHGPLALVLAPNGHLLVTNNDGINPNPSLPSEIVEFTIGGEFVKQISLDPAFGGAFGLAVQAGLNQSVLAAVNDNTATIDIFHITN